MLYDLSSGGKVERLLLHPFSLHFLKENLFLGDSCAGFYGFFDPKVVFGCQENVQKVSGGTSILVKRNF